MRTVVLALALLVALGAAAHADDADPAQLFADGHFAAAGAGFEQRWSDGGDARDGINAVIAWRAAGRYAHARVLLGRVVARTPPTGAQLERVALLESKLATLTGTVTLAGELGGARVLVDAGAPELLGPRLVVDVGPHEISVEKPGCERWAARVVLRPREALELDVALACAPPVGVLHVTLVGASAADFTVDGQAQRVRGGDVNVELAPGRHRLRLEAAGRPVADEEVAIVADETVSRRIVLPWRARPGGWVASAGLLSTASGAGSASITTIGFGRAGRRLELFFELGVGTSFGAEDLGGAHPVAAFSGKLHVWLRPLLAGRAGRLRWALDVDPLAARWTQLRSVSLFGINDTNDRILTSWSFLPVTLSLEWSRWHAELVVWTVGITEYVMPDGFGLFERDDGYTETGYSAALSLQLGFWL